jgi:hypothetical protein
MARSLLSDARGATGAGSLDRDAHGIVPLGGRQR